MKNKIIDFVDDKYFIHLKDSFNNLPEHIKTAEIIIPKDSNEYALNLIDEDGTELKKFPINNEVNTYLSDYYFQKTASLLPPTAKAKAEYFINKAKQKYGLEKTASENYTLLTEYKNNKFFLLDSEKDINDYILKTANEVNIYSNELKDEDFALIKTANNKKKRFFRLHNEEQIKLACDFFDKNYKQMKISDRVQFSKNVLNKLASKKLPLYSKKILLYSGKAKRNDMENIKLAFETRKKLIQHNKEIHKMYDELFEKTAQYNIDMLTKLLYEIDKEAGLNNKYDIIPDPYQTYCKTENKKNEYDFLNNINLDKLASYFSEDIVKNFKNNKIKTYNSLNSTEKEILNGILE